jgi:hypothetical protein
MNPGDIEGHRNDQEQRAYPARIGSLPQSQTRHSAEWQAVERIADERRAARAVLALEQVRRAA